MSTSRGAISSTHFFRNEPEKTRSNDMIIFDGFIFSFRTFLFRERARRASRELKREKNDTSGGGRVSQILTFRWGGGHFIRFIKITRFEDDISLITGYGPSVGGQKQLRP